MDPVSDTAIDQVYHSRRLQLLKDLATKINQALEVTAELHTHNWLPVNNVKIEINDDIHYLYVAVCSRLKYNFFKFKVNLYIPQEVGYGYPYDDLFINYFCDIRYYHDHFSYIDRRSYVYLMLTYPLEVTACYSIFYNVAYTHRNLLDLLGPLINGSKRDTSILRGIKALIEEVDKSQIGIILKEMALNKELNELEITRLLLLLNRNELKEWSEAMIKKYKLN